MKKIAAVFSGAADKPVFRGLLRRAGPGRAAGRERRRPHRKTAAARGWRRTIRSGPRS
jgi:hypothetical protein